MDKLIEHGYLLKILNYDKDTGFFTWKEDRNNRTKSGSKAGYKVSSGYIKIEILGKAYSAHRLAIFYVTGEWPILDVDHINCIKDQNNIANLRECTKTQNKFNSSIYKNNKLGVKGVIWCAWKNKFKASAGLNSKVIHIGYYQTLEEASNAYQEFSIANHGEFYRRA